MKCRSCGYCSNCGTGPMTQYRCTNNLCCVRQSSLPAYPFEVCPHCGRRLLQFDFLGFDFSLFLPLLAGLMIVFLGFVLGLIDKQILDGISIALAFIGGAVALVSILLLAGIGGSNCRYARILLSFVLPIAITLISVGYMVKENLPFYIPSQYFMTAGIIIVSIILIVTGYIGFFNLRPQQVLQVIEIIAFGLISFLIRYLIGDFGYLEGYKGLLKIICQIFLGIGGLLLILVFILLILKGVESSPRIRNLFVFIVPFGLIILGIGYMEKDGISFGFPSQSIKLSGMIIFGLVILGSGIYAFLNLQRRQMEIFSITILGGVAVGAIGYFFSTLSSGAVATIASTLEIIGFVFSGVGWIILFIKLAQSVEPPRMWRILWEPVVGAILSILGLLTLSGVLFLFGLIIISTWIISQYFYSKFFLLNTEELKASIAADKFRDDHKEKKDLTPEETKEFKDLQDEVKSLIWKINFMWGWRWVVRLLGFTIISGIFISIGPDLSLQRKQVNKQVRGISGQTKGFIQSEFAKSKSSIDEETDMQILLEKFRLAGFSSAQMEEVLRKGDPCLIREIYDKEVEERVALGSLFKKIIVDVPSCKMMVEQGLTVDDFFNIRHKGLDNAKISSLLNKGYNFSASKVLKRKNLIGEQLYAEMLKDLEALNKEPSLMRVYFIKSRNFLWEINYLIFSILLIIDFFLLIYILLSYFMHGIHSFTDEMHDQAIYAWNKIQERQKKKEKGEDYKEAEDYKKIKEKAEESKKSLTAGHVILIDLAMEIGQLIWKRYQPEFLKHHAF